MYMPELIRKKRDGGELTAEEISYIINGCVSGEVPDYQLSAFAMAVFFRGMTNAETVALTLAMRDSGDKADLSGISGVKVDKHSTGGVGDKTTLIVAPIVAACGVKVAKMSGRGLGHTGGTVDKLESIPGFRTSISPQEMRETVETCGLSVTGQSGNMCPADKKLYALRDVTATVDSIPLIASSIMSKKLADGSESLYLDIYRDGRRSYEFLKLYLIPETNAAAKAQNKATLAAVNTIKSQRIIELTNGVAGLKNTSLRSKMLLLDWMQAYKESQEKKGVRGSGKLISNTMNVLRAFNAKATMRDINRDFCLAFINFLRNIYVSPSGKKLSQFTCVSYFGCFRGALNAAVREEIIAENPVNRLNTDEKIKMPESKREFLTIDEVKILIDTPCRREDVKGAFLFSCYCGLRISDVLVLKWKNVDSSAEQWRINIIMQKTRQPLYLPLSMNARKWMPERNGAGDEDLVFPTLPCEDTCNMQLKPWVKAAGITKHVTYHVSRHTFATMLLTLGADLYTVCKLLGHSDVKTTQIYAKIINKKKEDAISLIDMEFANT